jgi:hypothetical protein
VIWKLPGSNRQRPTQLLRYAKSDYGALNPKDSVIIENSPLRAAG